MRKPAVTALLLSLICAASAVAIQPQKWVHTTEADFQKGKTEHAVVTNLGDIKLATASQALGELPEETTVIYDLETIGGATIAAAGPEASLLRLKGDKLETILKLEGEQVFCLDKLGNKLLVAVSGEKTTRLAVLNGDKLETVAELKDTRYVWDTVVAGKTIYAATGNEGKLLAIDTSGKEAKVTELLDASQANILCLGRDKKGRIYAGTDTDGLVFRLTPDGKGGFDPFVLLDAAEPEIGALLVTQDGRLYVGTADAQQAKPGRLMKPATAETGRPAPDEAPKPGDLPGVPPKPVPKDGGDKPATPDTPKSPDTSVPDTPKSPDAPAPDVPKSPDTPSAADTPPADAKPAPPQPPTPEQYDQVRAEIRARLEKARQTGQLQAGANVPPSPGSSSRPSTTRRPSSSTKAKAGNAVYHIDDAGFVTEVFRESVMILKIVEDGNSLLVATGNEAQLYRVDPAAGETTIIADLDPQQIPAIARNNDGTILIGTANVGGLVKLDGGLAKTGTFLSEVQDAKQISLWGVLKITCDCPAGTTLTVETRTGNVEDPDQAAWSKWSKPQVVKHDKNHTPLTPHELKIESPPARFIQYRVTLAGDGKMSSVLDRVELAYVVPNMRPEIESIKAEYDGGSSSSRSSSSSAKKDDTPAAQTKLKIEWKASDPNGDSLTYKLESRVAGGDAWLPVASDLSANRHEWDTRRIPDGRYLLRVTASDAPHNTPDMVRTATRQSNPVVIDNTPPTLQKLSAKVVKGAVRISGTAADALSDIQSIHYGLDSTENWKPILPADLIFDSTSERFTITISDLTPGPHVVTVRAVDGLGNAYYRAVQVEVQ